MLTKYLRVILFLCVLLWGTSGVNTQTKGIVVDGVTGLYPMRIFTCRKTPLESD